MNKREIKFRIAIPPETLKDENGNLNKWKVMVIEGEIACNYPVAMLGNDHIMQFTGVRDRNEKEIYEGDILSLEMSTGFGSVTTEKAVVKFDGGAFLAVSVAYDGKYVELVSKFVEVIGNIWEHPELLKSV